MAATIRYLDATDDPQQVLKGMTATHLVPRAGRPEEVAKLVCFLASDDAAYITGVTLPVGGGDLG